MPRKPAKELNITEKESNIKEENKKETAKKSSVAESKKATASRAKKTTSKKTDATKSTKAVSKEVSKPKTTKSTSKKADAAKSTKAVPEEVSKPKTTKSTSKKATTTKSTKAVSEEVSKPKTTKSTSKTKTKKATTKKSSTSKTVKTSSKSKSTTRTTRSRAKSKEISPSTDLTKKIEVLEYYDLPYRYNQTIVKVLAQTPNTLFIYWDISDADRESFVKQYGEDFFNTTKPVLVIHNDTMNYSFEVDIDDFANSWYLHVNDSNCEYRVELGRRAKDTNNNSINIPNDYLYVTSSNTMDAPNDHILFDKNLKSVYFRDLKTNIITAKDITSISFLRNMGKLYSMYDLQGEFNENSWKNCGRWQLNLSNSSSSSSTFK